MIWREEKGQRVWLWIGVVFLVFYTGEAWLFWGPHPRVTGPLFLHLLYWAAFGAILTGLIARSPRNADPKGWLGVIQSAILGVTITSAVVGIPALIMVRTQDFTLGHAVLLFTISLAAVVIGSLSFNPGWLLAGCVWASAGWVILALPPVQDYVLGAAMAIGFIIVGALRKSLVATCHPAEKK
jgi:hypothetical protein